MKTNIRITALLCSFIAMTNYATPVYAQFTHTPDKWGAYIESEENILVKDTFKLQTFSDSRWDNWLYETDKKNEIFDVSTIDGSADHLGGMKALKLHTGNPVSFSIYDTTGYTDIATRICYAANKTENNNILTVTINQGNSTRDASIKAKQNTDYSTIRHAIGCDFLFSATENNTEDYFYLRYIFTDGNIAQASLFTGEGNWTDATHWSHRPAERHRQALIAGTATVNQNLRCDQIALGSGSLTINNECLLETKDIDLFDTEVDTHPALYTNGTLDLKGQVHVHKTFAQKGVWYFISFPFDVYPSAISSDNLPNGAKAFEQQDETFTGAGNYFYVMQYNGDKRATTSQQKGNWEVVPVIGTDAKPLFEKNKGYLIALDQEAESQTLCFSSKEGTIPSTFGQTGTISITMEEINHTEDDAHCGWYLCGNPLPSPLPLSAIQANRDLGDHIYVYNGKSYDAYAIGGNSNYVLPPFAAFFVKAKKPTTLQIVRTPQSFTKAPTLIAAHMPLRSTDNEPVISSEIMTSIETSGISDLSISLSRQTLQIKGLKRDAQLQCYTTSGQLIFQRPITAETNNIPLPLPQGCYILRLITAKSSLSKKAFVE